MAGQVYNFYEMTRDPSGVYWAFGKGSTFGGASDPMDSGSTASGFSTKDHPHTRYCALPQAVVEHYGFPWFCRVTFENIETGHQTHAFLADYGPAGWTGRQFDLGPDVMVSAGLDTDVRCKFYVDSHTIVDPLPNEPAESRVEGPTSAQAASFMPDAAPFSTQS